MESLSSEEKRQLDAQCSNPRSGPARRAVVKLRALPQEYRVDFLLVTCTQLDLGNLGAAGAGPPGAAGGGRAPLLSSWARTPSVYP